MSQGTVPIYWGCPSIGDFFDANGYIAFDALADIPDILAMLSKEDYEARRQALAQNLEIARGYACAEDWMMRRYPWLFAA